MAEILKKQYKKLRARSKGPEAAVAERGRVGEEMEAEKEKFKNFFEIIIDGIVVNDEKGKMIEVNKSMAQMFGCKSPKEMIGKSIFSNIAEREAPRISKLFEDARKKKEPEIRDLEVICRREDGSELTVMFNIRHQWDKDKYLGSISVARDISLCKQVGEALKENEERYRTILEASDAGINLLDKDAVFLVVNNRAAEIWHKKPEEIIGKSLRDLGPPEFANECMPVFRRVLKTGRAEKQERFIVPLNKYFIEDIRPVRDGRGELIGVQVMTFDITERKQAEKSLEQKNIALREIVAQIEVEKNKIKEDVAANVDELLLPVLKKLRLKGASRKYLDLIKRNLESLTSSFGRKISEKRFRLSPREIEISDMIKDGLTNKEISGLLGVSHQTIEKHRKNIREKLGLSNRKINLAAFLQQL